jgi:hypothetical protein
LAKGLVELRKLRNNQPHSIACIKIVHAYNFWSIIETFHLEQVVRTNSGDYLSLSFNTFCSHKHVRNHQIVYANNCRFLLLKGKIDLPSADIDNFFPLCCFWCFETTCKRHSIQEISMGHINNDNVYKGLNPILRKDNVHMVFGCLECEKKKPMCNWSWTMISCLLYNGCQKSWMASWAPMSSLPCGHHKKWILVGSMGWIGRLS